MCIVRGCCPITFQTPRTHDHDMSKWLLLPDEMWLHVFSYLPQKDLAKAACVCKQLYRVAMDETLCKLSGALITYFAFVIAENEKY